MKATAVIQTFYGGKYRVLRPAIAIALATATTSYLFDPNSVLLSPGLCLFFIALAWVSAIYACSCEWRALRSWPGPVVLGALLMEVAVVSGVRNTFFAAGLRPADQHYVDLQAAILKKDVASVRAILARDDDPDHLPPATNCDMNGICESQDTPLFTAVKTGQREIATALIEHGAAVSRYDVGASTLPAAGALQSGALLPAAADKGDIPMMQLLIRYGARVNDGDRNSLALEHAIDKNQQAAALFLIAQGANPNSKNVDGSGDDTPCLLRLARSTNNAPMVQLLKRAGAK